MTKIDLVIDYINRCDNVIATGDISDARDLFLQIQSLFETDIPDFMNGLKSEIGSAYLDWENTNPYWLFDIPLIKAKLQKYISANLQASQPVAPQIIINNTNSNSAAFNNSIDVTALLQTTQLTIKEMGSLSDEETKIALDKVNELAKIIQSKENRKGKWSKVASIFKWLAEKSVDLAVALSPLIIQALQGMH